ncbi:MAG: porin family protein [Marinobacter sp.]|nr:porin family protein [Marinobacter sp.]
MNLLLAALLLPGQALAAVSFNMGLNVSRVEADNRYLDGLGDEGFRDGNLGAQVGLGYQFNPYVLAEVTWLALDVDRLFSELTGQNLYGKSLRFSVDGSYPLRDWVGVYGRGGWHRWDVTVRPDYGKGRTSFTGSDPMAGAGLRFGTLDQVHLDLGYDYYRLDDLRQHSWSLVLRYLFRR